MNLVDIKWFASLLAEHNDPASEYHMDMFEPFVTGRDLNPAEIIVYMNLNISSLWFIFNIFLQHRMRMVVSIEWRCDFLHQQDSLRCRVAHTWYELSWARQQPDMLGNSP